MQVDFFKCLQCGGPEVRLFQTSWECCSCGAQYAVEQEIPFLIRDLKVHKDKLDEAKSVKPDWYLQEQPLEQASPWRHHLRKRRVFVEKSIVSYLNSIGRTRVATLLDLGCGDGNHLEYLQKYTVSIYGSDYNPVRLVRSHVRSSSATLFLADILDYPAQDGFFDIIFFNHVIEHIPQDEAALKVIHRILKPGGLLILGTPNEGAWWWQLAYKLQPETRKSTDHVRFYTASSLSKRITEAGFQINQVKHMGWGPPHWELDGRIRKHKWVDDAFEFFGRILIPRQASSLYVLAIKPEIGK